MKLLREIEHPSVVKLYDTFESPGSGRVQLVLELCSGADLHRHLAGECGARRRAAPAVSCYPLRPIMLETFRSCLQDVFDLPGLIDLMAGIRAREIRVDDVETRAPSPFARNLVFAYTATYLYQLDLPAAERRTQALALDRHMLMTLVCIGVGLGVGVSTATAYDVGNSKVREAGCFESLVE